MVFHSGRSTKFVYPSSHDIDGAALGYSSFCTFLPSSFSRVVKISARGGCVLISDHATVFWRSSRDDSATGCSAGVATRTGANHVNSHVTGFDCDSNAFGHPPSYAATESGASSNWSASFPRTWSCATSSEKTVEECRRTKSPWLFHLLSASRTDVLQPRRRRLCAHSRNSSNLSLWSKTRLRRRGRCLLEKEFLGSEDDTNPSRLRQIHFSDLRYFSTTISITKFAHC